jgi:hypothetical protein
VPCSCVLPLGVADGGARLDGGTGLERLLCTGRLASCVAVKLALLTQFMWRENRTYLRHLQQMQEARGRRVFAQRFACSGWLDF